MTLHHASSGLYHLVGSGIYNKSYDHKTSVQEWTCHNGVQRITVYFSHFIPSIPGQSSCSLDHNSTLPSPNQSFIKKRKIPGPSFRTVDAEVVQTWVESWPGPRWGKQGTWVQNLKTGTWLTLRVRVSFHFMPYVLHLPHPRPDPDPDCY